MMRRVIAAITGVALSLSAEAGPTLAHAQRPPAEVIVFSMPECAHCTNAKRLLARKHTPYQVVDMTTPEGAEMSRQMGVPSIAPVFVYRGKMLTGFSPEDLLRLIEE